MTQNIIILILIAILIAIIIEMLSKYEENIMLKIDKEKMIAIKEILKKEYKMNKKNGRKEIKLSAIESRLIIEELETIKI